MCPSVKRRFSKSRREGYSLPLFCFSFFQKPITTRQISQKADVTTRQMKECCQVMIHPDEGREHVQVKTRPLSSEWLVQGSFFCPRCCLVVSCTCAVSLQLHGKLSERPDSIGFSLSRPGTQQSAQFSYILTYKATETQSSAAVLGTTVGER